MRWFLRWLLHIFLLLILLALSWGLLAIAPFPWRLLNLLVVYLTIHLLIRDHGSIVWIAFAAFYGVELYSLTPFGLVLLSGTVATLVTLWLYRSFITNRTPLAAAALAVLMVGVYRVLYFISSYIIEVRNGLVITGFGTIITSIFWEMVLTAAAAAIIYYLSTHVMAGFRLTTLRRSLYGRN